MTPRIARLAAASLLVAGAAACSRDGVGPDATPVQLGVLAGDAQFGLPGDVLEEPLQVLATDDVTEAPAAGIRIEWRVVSGDAAVLTASSTTDARGIAATQVRLGAALGPYVVEARAQRLVGDPARFESEAVQRPAILGIAPAPAAAGDTVTVTGTGFNPVTDYNAVLFEGIRGHVVSGTATQLRVVVPACVPTRTVEVTVALGAVASEPVELAAVGGDLDELSLAPGAARVFADAEELACLRVPGSLSNASWLLIVQNAPTAYSLPMPFQLTVLNGAVPGARVAPAPSSSPLADRWEHGLRAREQLLFDARVDAPAVTPQQLEPVLGERRSFRVLSSDQQESVTISAEVRAISEHAVIYVDLAAPAGGFTAADLEHFGALFDDPIYPATAGVFGSPSDLDANGRVIILLTPRVNALTPRGETSFIAGYFYGCDLVARSRCADTNSGEIFYSLVPDPQGQFSDPRGAADLLRNVPPVLAHEFQHMISFAQREQSLDALWLSEALAHTAEDIVSAVFTQRGETTLARDFRRPNYLRAHRYLAEIDAVSMIADDGQGSVELRGAGWLFLRYLRGQYGGDALLARLTQTTLSSIPNVTTQTGQSWAALLSDFALALYADGAPELAGITVSARHTFPDFDPRAAITQEVGSWPLAVMLQGFGDGGMSGELPSVSSRYLRLDAPANTPAYAAVNLVFSGARGGAFRSGTVPQLSIMRLR